ncbi:MAG: DHH family phosphoesterase [Oscillospiraceae bacterium]|nr:DHH family phosphoesterase [Oscillospiraceae bacterium]
MKNNIWSTETLVALLGAVCVMLAVVIGIRAPDMIFVRIICVVVCVFAVAVFSAKLRKVIHNIFYGSGKQAALQQTSFEYLSIPLCIVSNESVVWYNSAFREQFLGDSDMYLAPLKKILPDFDIKKTKDGVPLKFLNREYTVYSSNASEDGKLWICYFVNDTTLKHEASEYHLSRPVIMQIVVDTYEEALKDLSDSTRSQILTNIDALVEKYAGETGGISIKLGTARYYLIIEERNFAAFYNSKFDILEKARAINEEVTLSIGVGRGGADMPENDSLAGRALDMALGRGGDQAVVKTREGYEFFGGTKQGVEKNSKVRSRIVANALKDVVMQSDIVLCMGHKASDFDSVGACVGIAAAVHSLGKKAYVVVREESSLAQNVIAAVREEDSLKDLFITPERAMLFVSDKALLVIADTHSAVMCESEELAARCQRKVIIDHHRRRVDYISDTVVSYHEPNASSACELVSELLQYIMPTRYKSSAVVANAVLAGIMLDTKNFSEKTGVRTFEAAAYLRRLNASTTEVYKYFNVSREVYKARSDLINKAEIYNGIAVVMSEALPKDLAVAIPQAANELMRIDGINASIVAVSIDDKINISARSLGAVNVQLIMERLGGGGHLTMAGAQLTDCTLDEAKNKIMEAISRYSLQK